MSKAHLNIVCIAAMMVFSLLLQSNICSATDFIVGDAKGWSFNVAVWENGKSFKAGDVLVFNYHPGVHTVVEVNKANFDTCTPSGTTHTSGSDRITLKKGSNFFICGIGNHCQSLGVKIAANAA